MQYRNHTPRCIHGMALGLIRCEECDGRWNDANGKIEPRKIGERKSPRRLLLAGQSKERSRRREMECRVPSSYRERKAGR